MNFKYFLYKNKGNVGFRKQNLHSFPDIIRTGWEFPGAGTPLTIGQLDVVYPVESK